MRLPVQQNPPPLPEKWVISVMLKVEDYDPSAVFQRRALFVTTVMWAGGGDNSYKRFNDDSNDQYTYNGVKCISKWH